MISDSSYARPAEATGFRNIAHALTAAAAARPEQIAIACPSGRDVDGRVRYGHQLNYADLDRRSSAIAAGLELSGLQRGQRAVLMVRPTPEFFLLMFALLKLGAAPVLVDPGISRRALKQCLDEAQPQAFIGISLAHAARCLLGWARGSIELNVTVGRRWFWGGPTLAEVEARGVGLDRPLAGTLPDDVAAILFTSGSTGVPKGVIYRHRHFVAQVDLLREALSIEPGGVDLPTFPPFALFDPALGLTSIIPDMDPTRPASADPRRLIQAVEQFSVTRMFGSPALLDTLSRYGERHGVTLPTLKQVTSAGAPVPPAVVARMQAMLPEDAEIWTPYGATECLPVAVIEGRELRATRQQTEAGAGTCVGRPVSGNTVRIIAISDSELSDWSAVRELPAGEVGEITVAGPSATDAYFHRAEATALAKISETGSEGSTRIVHRMGDLGWFDEQGRLWFCGRKSQRVETADGPLYTEQVEPPLCTVSGVQRTALVGVGQSGQQRPVICVEFERDLPRSRQQSALAELRAMLQQRPATRSIADLLVHPRFPVDIRHNAKIGREQLARWAAGRLPA